MSYDPVEAAINRQLNEARQRLATGEEAMMMQQAMGMDAVDNSGISVTERHGNVTFSAPRWWLIDAYEDEDDVIAIGRIITSFAMAAARRDKEVGR